MKPTELLVDDPAPQRVLIASRADLHEAIEVALKLARRSVRVLHRDLSVFELSSNATTQSLERLLLGDRNARVRLLVDDPAWLDTRAARLRLLQRRFPHALELRVTAPDDPAGDEAIVLVDGHGCLELRPTRDVRGEFRVHNEPHAQPLLAGFDRRWDAGAHNLPVSPLGLA